MDRSLQFFVSVYNLPNPNIDSATGLNKSSYTVTYNINTYDSNDPLAGSAGTDSKNVNYNVVNSMQSDSQFINYLGNSTTNDYKPYTSNPEYESDISLASIITWSQQKGMEALKLNYGNLAYHKDVKVYPANRLMVLRRFPGAVNDNLFSTTVSPICTMCTFYDFEKLPITISFNEEWTQFSGSFLDVLSDVIGIHVGSLPVIGNAINTGASSNLAQDIFSLIAQKLNIITDGGMPYGDPNIVYDSAVRVTDGENLKTGLSNSISVKFEATYILREINGVDAKAAMLDLIATATAMGTSNSRFYVSESGGSTIKLIMDQMAAGNIDTLFKDIINGLSDIIKNASAALVKLGKDILAAQASSGTANAVISTLDSAGSILLKNRYSRYKWRMQGVLGALTGMATAPWHVTLGNPKFPWFTMGNLYIESATMNFGGEVAYNDMFTDLHVSYTFKNGRPLGASEIQSLFNSGRGRIYDTPDKIQSLYVPKDVTVKTPGTEAISPTTTTSVPPADTVPVNTDQTNSLDASGIPSTPFSNDTEDTDNNIDNSYIG